MLNTDIINSYISVLSELEVIHSCDYYYDQTKIDNLDKEIQFFNILHPSSIYKCQEIIKLKSYVRTVCKYLVCS